LTKKWQNILEVEAYDPFLFLFPFHEQAGEEVELHLIVQDP
jgi:hypothetical protein